MTLAFHSTDFILEFGQGDKWHCFEFHFYLRDKWKDQYFFIYDYDFKSAVKQFLTLMPQATITRVIEVVQEFDTVSSDPDVFIDIFSEDQDGRESHCSN